jgi:hypothetical protein
MEVNTNKSEVSESAFEYLLCEILAIECPDIDNVEQVRQYRIILLLR